MNKYTFRVDCVDGNAHILEVEAENLKEAWVKVSEYIGHEAEVIRLDV